MSKPIIGTRKLSELKEKFFVRVALDHDRVEHLKKLHDNGVKLDPMIVSTSSDPDLCDVIVDGRHRKTVYVMSEEKEVECEIRHYNSVAEMIIDAWRANSGGPLPPTQRDVIHTLQILLESGQSRRAIIEVVSKSIGLTPRLVKRQLDEVQSLIAKAQVAKAKNDVIKHDLSVKEAADKYGVDVKTLQRNLGMDKKEDKGSNQQIKSSFSMVAKKLSLTIGHNMSQTVRDLKDGITSEDTAANTFAHLDRCIKNLVHVHHEWRTRLASHVKVPLKSSVEVISTRHGRKPKVVVVAAAAKHPAKAESPDVAAMRANARRQFKNAQKPSHAT